MFTCVIFIAQYRFQKEHLDFVYAASIIRAQMYSLTPFTDREAVRSLATAIPLPDFVPKEGVRIAVSDAEAEQMTEDIGLFCK